LTAAEHLRIFAKLKGLAPKQVEREIQEKLKETSLSHVANQRVGQFSGGMKRRLSIAISSIGNPQIIFMDEPTTGLDPVNKRSVWHMVQEMKKDRVIVLTTHAMEEADVLGDRIGVMVLGKLRCIGNSLHLKNK
jgi:ABC-type multidrug transport system ATPase subunit